MKGNKSILNVTIIYFLTDDILEGISLNSALRYYENSFK